MAQYKKAGTIQMEPAGRVRRTSAINHGAIAGVLLLLALVARFVIPIGAANSDQAAAHPGAWYLANAVAALIWIWGCVHLAVRFKLHPAWGFFGLLFLVGIAIIFWAAQQRPVWERQKALRSPASRKRQVDPNSLY